MAEISSYYKDIQKIFTQNLPWNNLSGTNILVTGATGLIGGCLVDTLMLNPNKDYQVYASGRNEKRAIKRFANYTDCSDFHFVKYDVLEPLKSCINFDYIIHAASNASPNFFVQKPVEVIRSNIEGVHNLLDYGLKHHLRRFLFVSTGEVYGEGDGRVFTEDYSGYVNCATPRACYPSSKRAAETLCMSYAAEYGANVVVARLSHIYGPFFTEQDNRVYAQFLRNVLRGEDIVMKSAGTQFRSWCYVVDAVSALLFVLLKGANSEVYNVADAESNISIKELAEIIANYAGRKVVMEMPDEIEKRGYNVVTKSVFAVERLRSLGWKSMTHIEQGLAHTMESLRSKKYERNDD